MTDHITAHETGRAGRPLSPATRRSRLRMHYIKAIGVENLTPALREQIQAAVELTAMAAEHRVKLAKGGSPTSDDLLAAVRLENAASRAVSKLDTKPVTSINTFADATTLSPRGRAEALLLVVEAIERAVDKLGTNVATNVAA
jgi:hypothetical protein